MKRQFKLSGAANRKRKKEEEEKRVQSRDALRKYLQPQQQPVKAATEESEEASVSMSSAQVEDPEGGPSTSIISINREISKQISYDATIDDFAARKSRRIRF